MGEDSRCPYFPAGSQPSRTAGCRPLSHSRGRASVTTPICKQGQPDQRGPAPPDLGFNDGHNGPLASPDLSTRLDVTAFASRKSGVFGPSVNQAWTGAGRIVSQGVV